MAMSARFMTRVARGAIRTPARAFSDAHAPPVKIFGIHARYANATYTAASKQSKLDQVENELQAFKEVLVKQPNFASYLSNPTFSRDEKVAAIEKIFGGKKISSVTRNLMVTLAANARIGEFDKVEGAFTELTKAARGQLDVTVTTAKPLTSAEAKRVNSVLKTIIPAKANVTQNVNPAILGGLTLEIGSNFLDLSSRSKLNKYKSAISRDD